MILKKELNFLKITKLRYEEILKQLEAVDLKEKFTADFENKCSENLLSKIKTSDKIHSVGSILRLLISFYEYKSERWEFWKNVLHYFIMPDFVKDKSKLTKL